MHRNIVTRLLTWLLLAILFTGQAYPQAVFALEGTRAEAQQAEKGVLVVQSTHWDTSPALRSLSAAKSEAPAAPLLPLEIPNPILPKALRNAKTEPGASAPPAAPAAAQAPQNVNLMPAPLLNFDGISNLFGGWPPDTQGDIGSNYYVQWINLHFAIWQIDRVNHSASLVYGPVEGKTLFQGFGGPCAISNHGDPITLYDPLANRWFMSQFALPNYPSGPFYECVAVSAGSDPTGAWHRYEFQMPVDKMNDYPKFGVWPTAYFMTVNQFNGGSLSWGGAGVAALERQAMLAGEPARMVFFDLYNINQDFGGMLPADFDGQLLPPDGAPGYFAEWDDGSWIPSQDALRVWEFRIDWSRPDEATFGVAGLPNWVIPTDNVDPSMCAMSRNCIPQPGTSNKVDAISDRLMYRLQYRNFGGYATLVTNHTVDVDGTDHAGIHWFELRKDTLGADWQLYQQGIYAPDANQRWMGSLAMDHVGDIALGYSVSSSTIYPSVRYAGRLAGDPPGALPQGEQSLVAGNGAQLSSNRWGDYSMMGLDPQDDCTFWYTQQYVQTSGYNSWKTRIGAFRFPGCSVGPQGQAAGKVIRSPGGEPIESAQVSAVASITQTLTTQTNASGNYLIVAPVGVYTITASAYGYYPQTVASVPILADQTKIQDFALELAPNHVISGFIRDAQTGWPLYGKVTPLATQSIPVWSDPASGFFSLTIPEGIDFTLQAEAYLSGYRSMQVVVPSMTEDLSLNFDLQIDPSTCNAPGYLPNITQLFNSTFEADSGGLNAAGTTSWAWGTISSGPGSAHSGLKGWATNPSGNYIDNENGFLSLPSLDFSAYAGQTPALGWWQWLDSEARYDYASLEASKDGGVSWQTIYGPLSGNVDAEWTYHYLLLGSSYAVSDLRLRFHFTSDGSVVYPGWYLDDVSAGIGSCLAQTGGMVTGTVTDANTGAGLNDAQIEDEAGGKYFTQPTPNDPNVSDGFYVLFSPADTHIFTATYGVNYQPGVESTFVPAGNTVRQDFSLQAGQLAFTPDRLEVSLKMGHTLTRTLTLTNQGGAALDYELLELKGGPVLAGPIEKPNFAVKPFKADRPNAQEVSAPPEPQAEPISAGQVLQSWAPSGLSAPWAAAYDAINDTVWASSPASFWNGVDRIAEYSPTGTPTGRLYNHAAPHTSGPADLAYNWNTGGLWIMNVNTGIANCIYEIDPDAGYTGNKICPGGPEGFSTSQRGLAYDPESDTWFAGGWNDLMVHRFDSAGNLLSSVNTGLLISGLAYNPESHHLFALVNNAATRVYVLDTANNYALIGQFTISQGFDPYSGGGLEFDCQGNLWGVDTIAGKLVQFSSGETPSLCLRDVPWISSQPAGGNLAPFASQTITVTFDASVPEVDHPGTYLTQLKFKENTPYLVSNVPVTMTVLPLEYGVAISPEVTAKQGIPGERVAIGVQITNTSEGLVDAFRLSTSPSAWPLEIQPVSLLGPLPSGASGHFTIRVIIPETALPGDQQKLTIMATSQGNPVKSASAELTFTAIEPNADLELGMSASPGSYWVSQPLVHRVTITNHGPTAAPSTTFVDVFSSRLLYVSDSAGLSGKPGCTLNGSVLSCELGWLDPGVARSFTISLLPIHPGLAVSQGVAVAQASDPNPADNIVALMNVIQGIVYYFPWVVNIGK